MISRTVQCTIDTRKVEQFRNTLNNEFLPRIQAQPGFVDSIESLDASTGQFVCVTIWRNPTDVQNYDKGLFQEIAAAVTPLTTVAPTVVTLPVENSSAHRVRAGKAAA